MAKRKIKKDSEKVTIDGKDYDWDKLSEEARVALNHVADLDNKINSAQFNVNQLVGGRTFWMSEVNNALGVKNEARDSKEL